MVFNTTSVSIPGLIMVFSASACAGLRWALTELVMRKSSMGLSNPFATIFWLAPLMALTIGLISMAVEGWFKVFASEHFQDGKALATIGVIILPGGIAFAMVASEYLQVHLPERCTSADLQYHPSVGFCPAIYRWNLQGSHHDHVFRLGIW